MPTVAALAKRQVARWRDAEAALQQIPTDLDALRRGLLPRSLVDCFRAAKRAAPCSAQGRKQVFDPNLGTTASMHSAYNQLEASVGSSGADVSSLCERARSVADLGRNLRRKRIGSDGGSGSEPLAPWVRDARICSSPGVIVPGPQRSLQALERQLGHIGHAYAG